MTITVINISLTIKEATELFEEYEMVSPEAKAFIESCDYIMKSTQEVLFYKNDRMVASGSAFFFDGMIQLESLWTEDGKLWDMYEEDEEDAEPVLTASDVAKGDVLKQVRFSKYRGVEDEVSEVTVHKIIKRNGITRLHVRDNALRFGYVIRFEDFQGIHGTLERI